MSVLRRLWHILRTPRRWGNHLRLLIDLIRFRSRYGFLRERTKIPSSQTILIVSLTDWVAQAKMEGVFCKILESRGYTPVVLTNSTSRWAIRTFRSFGVRDFLFFNELTDQAASRIHPADVNRILVQGSSFRALFDATVDGNDLGRHVLSTVVRQLRGGSGSFDDPRAQSLIRSLVPRSLAAHAAARKLFSRVQPNAVLFSEKGYTPFGEVFDAALERNFNVIQYLHTHRADAVALKRYNLQNRFQHTFSLSAASWERVKRMPWSSDEERAFMDELRRSYEEGTWFNRKFLLEGKKVKPPEEVRAQLGLDPRKKTAVIFSHVLWDATFFYGESLFDDYEQWLIETVKVACANTAVNWVIKLHPDYVWKMKQMGEHGDPRDIVALQSNIGALPEHVKVVLPTTDISTYAFFPVTDWCITVRGTIGIEAPCFGIPVLTAGTGRYSGLGFTNDSATREEYLQKLRNIQSIPRLTEGQTSLACRHAHALFNLRPLPFSTFEMTHDSFGKLGHALDHNVVIRASSLEQYVRAPDLNTFAGWVLNSSDEDYLHLS